MKHVITLLFFVGLTSLTSAQNQLAMNTTPDFGVRTSISSSAINDSYIHTSKDLTSSLAFNIRRFQNAAAEYDITENKVYTRNRHVTYSVVFTADANYIKAIYDHNGRILTSEEYYEEVRIPYSIGSEVAKAYPGWSFENSSCSIHYAVNEATRITYDIELKRGTSVKRVSRTLLKPVFKDTRSAGM